MKFEVLRPTLLTAADIAGLSQQQLPPVQVCPDGIAELLSLMDIRFIWDDHHSVWYFTKGPYSWRMHPEYLRTWEDWTRAVEEIREKLVDLERP